MGKHAMKDPYLDMINSQWDNIIMMYQTFQDKKPIIEYEIDTQRIYSYRAQNYLNCLGIRTRDEAKRQYEEAVKKNKFMLFIKDIKNEVLRSYIFNLPD